MTWKKSSHWRTIQWITFSVLRKKALFGAMVVKMEGLLGGSDGQESVCNAGDLGSTPGGRRFPRERNSNPLQYSCLENSMDIGAWQATVHGVAKSQTWLNNTHTHTHTHTHSDNGNGGENSDARECEGKQVWYLIWYKWEMAKCNISGILRKTFWGLYRTLWKNQEEPVAWVSLDIIF